MALNIKETKRTDEKPEPTYPRLMKGKTSGNIYLMKDKKNGVVLSTGSNGRVEIGVYMPDLDPDLLQNYTGSITLSNKD